MKLHTHSSTETQQLAATIAALVLSEQPSSHACVVTLQGELGAGKTTFTQGFLKSLGIRRTVTSPTFVLMKRYSLKGSHFKNAYHLDCYRLKNPTELLTLGIKEILSDSRNLVLIEWPENISSILPKDMKVIQFHHGKKEYQRTISFRTI
jgi:tRNA threonylcarbamoyladenosine biosynthesis protein TsaE